MSIDIKRFEYLTITGNTLLLPLFTIVWRLLNVTAESIPSKANERESAWSLSAIAIAAVMLESALVRAQWEWQEAHGTQDWVRNALDFYKRLGREPSLSGKLPDITELFVARDLIFHNHLYVVTGQYEPERAFVAAKHLQGGDSKFELVVDALTYRTKTLGLNVIPSLITRRDVSKYLAAMVACLEAMIAAGLLLPQFLTDQEPFGNAGERRTLKSVAQDLERSDVPMVD